MDVFKFKAVRNISKGRYRDFLKSGYLERSRRNANRHNRWCGDFCSYLVRPWFKRARSNVCGRKGMHRINF